MAQSYNDRNKVPEKVDTSASPQLRCLSMKDGKELGRMDLPGFPCREGTMSFGRGRLYVALEDGQLVAME